MSRMKSVCGVCTVSLAVAATCVAPAHAIPAGCSVGVFPGGTQFYSECAVGSVTSHNARVQIYYYSSYSATRYSRTQPAGIISTSDDYVGVGYVMDGPWIQVTY